MKAKTKIKIALDAAMTLALLFLMGYQFWGEALHEWVGVGIFAAFIAHHILNLGWYRTFFHGRYTPMRVFQLCVDMLTLAAMLALMYSSVVMSRYAFSFLGIDGSMALARKLHILGSYWGMVLMSLHLGLHWNMLLTVLGKRDLRQERSRTKAIILFIVGLAIAAYGAYVFVSRDYPTYLFLRSEFVFLDYDEPRILYYLDYLSLMGMFIFISHYLSKGLKKIGGSRTKKEAAK